MEFKENREKDWKEGLDNNQDGYGRAVYTYAQRWAESIEKAIKEGKKLEKVADDLSHETDKEGITGFMYGAAVSVLSDVWIHGEELRTWHNIKTQIGNEGEKANKEGGVLNPAILNMELKKE